jgi:hypothetical protein
MVQPNPGVTIETWAVVKDDASIEYLVSCDGDGVEFSFGQTGWTTGLSINITAQGLRRCVETFTSALSDLDARTPQSRPGTRLLPQAPKTLRTLAGARSAAPAGVSGTSLTERPEPRSRNR